MSRITIEQAQNHSKGWGSETWLVNNSLYCGKLLNFDEGATFSDHYHIEKTESWYVLEGELELRHYDLASGERLIERLSPGSVVHIPKSSPHQLHAITRAVVIEVSTPHEELDSYRIAPGDSQRAGKGYDDPGHP